MLTDADGINKIKMNQNNITYMYIVPLGDNHPIDVTANVWYQDDETITSFDIAYICTSVIAFGIDHNNEIQWMMN